MIPDTGDIEHLKFYIKQQILDLVSSILTEIEDYVSKGIPQELSSTNFLISTSLDIEKGSTSSDNLSKLKKQKQGRLSKIKGDYCLLAGSPKDAIIK